MNKLVNKLFLEINQPTFRSGLNIKFFSKSKAPEVLFHICSTIVFLIEIG